MHRVITRHLLGQSGLKPDEADSGAVTLIQRFGLATSLDIHLHCLVLDGVYRRGADDTPAFVEAPALIDEALQTVLHKIITRTTQAASTDNTSRSTRIARQAVTNGRSCAPATGSSRPVGVIQPPARSGRQSVPPSARRRAKGPRYAGKCRSGTVRFLYRSFRAA